MGASIPPAASSFGCWEGAQPSLLTWEFHPASCLDAASAFLHQMKPSGHPAMSPGDLRVWV